LHGDKDHQTPFVGGPITHTTNPRWRTAAILKKDNSSYIHNDLTDRRKIWQGDANWPSPPYRPLKIRTFKNRRWRTAAILNIEKPRYFGNGMTDRRESWHDIFAKFGTLRDPDLLTTTALSKWNQKLIRDVNGRHLEYFNNVITTPLMVQFM